MVAHAFVPFAAVAFTVPEHNDAALQLVFAPLGVTLYKIGV